MKAKDKKLSYASYKLRHSNTFDNLNKVKKNNQGSQLKRTFTIDRRVYTIVEI